MSGDNQVLLMSLMTTTQAKKCRKQSKSNVIKQVRARRFFLGFSAHLRGGELAPICLFTSPNVSKGSPWGQKLDAEAGIPELNLGLLHGHRATSLLFPELYGHHILQSSHTASVVFEIQGATCGGGSVTRPLPADDRWPRPKHRASIILIKKQGD